MNGALPLIQCENISKDYINKKGLKIHAVSSVNLSVNRGETFGLIGESGCGKSTLGYLLVHLLEPSEGHVLFNGKDIAQNSHVEERELRRKAQIIFQDPYASLDPKMKIGTLVREELDIYHVGKTKADREQLVNKMLAQVGLDSSFRQLRPTTLSGGQLQRVAIAQALILRPSFVVCDEPVSSLDVSIQAQVLNLLKDLQKIYHLTYFFISHNLNVMSYMADRIAVMYMGTIVELGSARQITEHPLHPYTKALFEASAVSAMTGQKVVLMDGDVSESSHFPSGCLFNQRCRYCRPVCRKISPPLLQTDDGRFCACHFTACAKTSQPDIIRADYE